MCFFLSFMQSFPELKQDEFSPYLQQSGSHNLTTVFDGTSTSMIYNSPLQLIQKLSYIIHWLFTGPASHGQITSLSMENSKILGVNFSTEAPVSQYQDIVFQNGKSSSVPSKLSSVIRAEVVGHQSSITDSCHLLNNKSLEIPSAPIFYPHSLPDYHDDSGNFTPYNYSGLMALNISFK